MLPELEKMTGEQTIIGPRGFSDQLHIQDTARYAILCTTDGQPEFQEYWTAGPVPKAVLLKMSTNAVSAGRHPRPPHGRVRPPAPGSSSSAFRGMR